MSEEFIKEVDEDIKEEKRNKIMEKTYTICVQDFL